MSVELPITTEAKEAVINSAEVTASSGDLEACTVVFT
jgi:hypothetical protein